MRLSRRIAFSCGLALCAGNVANGQLPEPGARVQTTIARVKRQFTLVALPVDSIVLRDASGSHLRLALSDLDSLHVNTVVRSGVEHFFRGAAKGFLILGGLGALVGYASGDDQESFLGYSAEEKAAVGAISWGVVGAILGGFIGLSRSSDRWVAVPIR